MKRLLTYYVLIITPLALLLWFSKAGVLNSTTFVCLLFAYALPYRTYIDGMRLAEKGIIQKKDIWKMIIPGKRIQHFVALYLK